MPDPVILDPAHDVETNSQVAALTRTEEKPAAPAIKVTEDGNQVEVGDHKYVRVEALHAERENVKRLQGVLNTLEPLMPEIDEFIKTKETRKQATVARVTDGGGEQYSDDELDAFAQMRGYYEDDNRTPDKRRAKAELDFQDRMATRAANRALRPIADQLTKDRTISAKERAARNREQGHSQPFVDGEPIADQRYIDAVYDAVPAEMASDPEVAKFLLVAAAGLEALDRRKSGGGREQAEPRRRREPMFVEGGRGRVDGAQKREVTDFDRVAARARGKSLDDWEKLSRRVNGDVLEEVD